jgi:aromatic ring-opening dioxygenase catalytic subunit (LigB family)
MPQELRSTLEFAILELGRRPEVLQRFQNDPVVVGAELGLTADWALVVAEGNRDRLRSAGVNDGVTILVSRWFRADLADSGNEGGFHANSLAILPSDVPANLVFAGGCSHVPDLLARPEIDPPDAVARLVGGYGRLAEALKLAAPDVLLVTADCHFQNFQTGAFVIGTGAKHRGSMSFFGRPDLDLEVWGDSAFAESMVKTIRDAGLEVEEAPEVHLDHGLIVPLRQLLADIEIPVVPIITQPARTFSPWNARAFGEQLRLTVEETSLRVGILATGGLSHWLDPGVFGKVDIEFDTHILELLQAGHGNDLAYLEPFALLSHGQYEFLNWLIMLSLVGPGVDADVYAYEPMVSSGGGWTVVNLPLDKAKNQR